MIIKLPSKKIKYIKLVPNCPRSTVLKYGECGRGGGREKQAGKQFWVLESLASFLAQARSEKGERKLPQERSLVYQVSLSTQRSSK